MLAPDFGLSRLRHFIPALGGEQQEADQLPEGWGAGVECLPQRPDFVVR